MNKNLNIATIFANDPHMSNCIWVTSAVAEQFLRSKTMAARKTSRQILNKYAEDMKNGRWQITPDPIVFNSKGNLMKGVHRLTALIERPLLKDRRQPLRVRVRTVCTHIGDGRPLAVSIPGALVLICGRRAAPQKILSQNRHFISPFNVTPVRFRSRAIRRKPFL